MNLPSHRRSDPVRPLLVCLALAFTSTIVRAQSSQPDAASTSPAGRHKSTTPTQTLLLDVSLSGDTVNDLAGESSAEAGPVVDVDGALRYSRRVSRATFDVKGRSIARGAEAAMTPLRQEGSFEVAVAGVRQQFHASQGVSYATSYQFAAATDSAAAPEMQAAESHGDFANAILSALASNTSVDWSRALTRRVTVSAFYNLRRTTFSRAELDMTSQETGASVARRLTRFVSLRAGFAHRVAASPLAAGQQARIDNIDGGIDFSRPLALSKRTRFSFASGSALAPDGGRMALHFTGDAALTRSIGRTWNARLAVNRAMRLVEGFAQPVLDNSIAATLGGNIRRHVSASVSGSLSTGTVGSNTGGANGFTNWRTASGVSVALTPHTAFDAQYFLVFHQFDALVPLPPGLENEQRRQGLRVGLTWHAPPLLRN